MYTTAEVVAELSAFVHRVNSWLQERTGLDSLRGFRSPQELPLRHHPAVTHLDRADRVFHLDVLRGGMNRLLYRSWRNDTFARRVEFLFMNVRYLALATTLHGPTIERIGLYADHRHLVAANLDDDGYLYRIRSQEGEGLVVAASLAVDEAEAGNADPSDFFMMS